MSARSNTRKRIVQLPKKQKEPEPTPELVQEQVVETATLDDLFSDETYNDNDTDPSSTVNRAVKNEPVLTNKIVFIKSQEVRNPQIDDTDPNTLKNVVHVPIINNKSVVNTLILNNRGLVDNRKN